MGGCRSRHQPPGHFAPLDPEEPVSETDLKWATLAKKLKRLRFCQRLWGNLGLYLQTYSADIREAVKKAFPKTV